MIHPFCFRFLPLFLSFNLFSFFQFGIDFFSLSSFGKSYFSFVKSCQSGIWNTAEMKVIQPCGSIMACPISKCLNWLDRIMSFVSTFSIEIVILGLQRYACSEEVAEWRIPFHTQDRVTDFELCQGCYVSSE